jgi:hypothetical protein
LAEPQLTSLESECGKDILRLFKDIVEELDDLNQDEDETLVPANVPDVKIPRQKPKQASERRPNQNRDIPESQPPKDVPERRSKQSKDAPDRIPEPKPSRDVGERIPEPKPARDAPKQNRDISQRKQSRDIPETKTARDAPKPNRDIPKKSDAEPPPFHPKAVKLDLRGDYDQFPDNSDDFEEFHESPDKNSQRKSFTWEQPREFMVDLIREPPPVDLTAERAKFNPSKHIERIRKG